jgi:hypothetical protein
VSWHNANHREIGGAWVVGAVKRRRVTSRPPRPPHTLVEMYPSYTADHNHHEISIITDRYPSPSPSSSLLFSFLFFPVARLLLKALCVPR